MYSFTYLITYCTDPARDSYSTRQCSACRCRRLRETVPDQAGVLRVWLQDLPDHSDQVQSSLCRLVSSIGLET